MTAKTSSIAQSLASSKFISVAFRYLLNHGICIECTLSVTFNSSSVEDVRPYIMSCRCHLCWRCNPVQSASPAPTSRRQWHAAISKGEKLEKKFKIYLSPLNYYCHNLYQIFRTVRSQQDLFNRLLNKFMSYFLQVQICNVQSYFVSWCDKRK